jgi:hypothetical protein
VRKRINIRFGNGQEGNKYEGIRRQGRFSREVREISL